MAEGEPRRGWIGAARVRIEELVEGYGEERTEGEEKERRREGMRDKAGGNRKQVDFILCGMTTIYLGPVINPVSLTSFLALPVALIAVGHDGNILWIDTDSDLNDAIARHGVQTYSLVRLKPGEFIMPGLIDTHIVRTGPFCFPPLLTSAQHACQFPNLGVYAISRPRLYLDRLTRDSAAEVTSNCLIGSAHIPFLPNQNSLI